jgi:hypothetical protein
MQWMTDNAVDDASAFASRELPPLRELRRTNSLIRPARYPPQALQEVALSNQRRVSPSVQPGTAKRAGAVTSWLGLTMRCSGLPAWTVRDLARCAVAASAEAHRATRRPRAITERIVIAPVTQAGTVARKRHFTKLQYRDLGPPFCLVACVNDWRRRSEVAHALSRRNLRGFQIESRTGIMDL